MAKTTLLLLLLLAPAGCGGGMARAYATLPDTFDDLAQKTEVFRHRGAATPSPRRPRDGRKARAADSKPTVS